MELASLAFMIDSLRAVTAVQVLDQMTLAAQCAKAGADTLSQGFQQQAMMLLQAQQNTDAVTNSWKAYIAAIEASAMAAKGMTDAIVKNVEPQNAQRGSVGLMTNEINLLTGATKSHRPRCFSMLSAKHQEFAMTTKTFTQARACEWCKQILNESGIPCSDASEADRRSISATTGSDRCKSELQRRGY
jgi:hypothetical protein